MGGRPSFLVEELDVVGLGNKSKVVLNALVKLGRAKLQARLGQPTTYSLVGGK